MLVEAALAVEAAARAKADAAAALQAEADAHLAAAGEAVAEVEKQTAEMRQRIEDEAAAEAALAREVDAGLAAAASGTASVGDRMNLFKQMGKMNSGAASMSNEQRWVFCFVFLFCFDLSPHPSRNGAL